MEHEPELSLEEGNRTALQELPCPFCGSDDQQVCDFSSEDRGDGAIVECVECGAQGPFAADVDAAVKAWDTRAEGVDALRLVKIMIREGGLGAFQPPEASPSLPDDPSSFTCPECGRVSYNLHDIEHAYVQGAVLADLLATWLAGHPNFVRESILSLHIKVVRELVPVNEAQLFGGRGHPQNER
jgi:Lar family restriction alleviation protein